ADYLRDPKPAARPVLTLRVVGEKEIGKTIFTRAASRQARQEFADQASAIEVQLNQIIDWYRSCRSSGARPRTTRALWNSMSGTPGSWELAHDHDGICSGITMKQYYRDLAQKRLREIFDEQDAQTVLTWLISNDGRRPVVVVGAGFSLNAINKRTGAPVTRKE